MNLRLLVPALAAVLALPGAASAATARIRPVHDTGTAGSTTTGIALGPNEDCRYRVGAVLLRAIPGEAAQAVWHSPLKNMNGCLGTGFDDGSLLDQVQVRFPTTRLPHGRAALVVSLLSRRWGGSWTVHRFVRTFWHRSAAAASGPWIHANGNSGPGHIPVPECYTGVNADGSCRVE